MKVKNEVRNWQKLWNNIVASSSSEENEEVGPTSSFSALLIRNNWAYNRDISRANLFGSPPTIAFKPKRPLIEDYDITQTIILMPLSWQVRRPGWAVIFVNFHLVFVLVCLFFVFIRESGFMWAGTDWFIDALQTVNLWKYIIINDDTFKSLRSWAKERNWKIMIEAETMSITRGYSPGDWSTLLNF